MISARKRTSLALGWAKTLFTHTTNETTRALLASRVIIVDILARRASVRAGSLSASITPSTRIAIDAGSMIGIRIGTRRASGARALSAIVAPSTFQASLAGSVVSIGESARLTLVGARAILAVVTHISICTLIAVCASRVGVSACKTGMANVCACIEVIVVCSPILRVIHVHIVSRWAIHAPRVIT